MNKHISKLKSAALAVVATTLAVCGLATPIASVSAVNPDAYGFTMSPLKENVILNPGDSYESSFTIHNPATNAKTFEYELSVTPFYVDENYNNIFTSVDSYNEIVDWITIDSATTGSLEPNEQKEIYFTIDVPSNAPAGGQYATVTVTSVNPTNEGDGSSILEKTAIAHTIFAEIAGNTTYSGDVSGVNVPSFLTSGKIYGESTIKNTGNVHGRATYTLSITPLFSNEEVFTNVESPASHDILPNRSYYSKTEWEETPAFGLFNVTYIVNYEGAVTEVSKLVIICPIWLMILCIAILAAIIIGIVLLVKKKRQ